MHSVRLAVERRGEAAGGCVVLNQCAARRALSLELWRCGGGVGRIRGVGGTDVVPVLNDDMSVVSSGFDLPPLFLSTCLPVLQLEISPLVSPRCTSPSVLSDSQHHLPSIKAPCHKRERLANASWGTNGSEALTGHPSLNPQASVLAIVV